MTRKKKRMAAMGSNKEQISIIRTYEAHLNLTNDLIRRMKVYDRLENASQVKLASLAVALASLLKENMEEKDEMLARFLQLVYLHVCDEEELLTEILDKVKEAKEEEQQTETNN